MIQSVHVHVTKTMNQWISGQNSPKQMTKGNKQMCVTFGENADLVS